MENDNEISAMDESKSLMCELRTVVDFIRWGSSRFNASGLFFGHGTGNALDEAAWLVLHTLHQPYDLPISYFNAVLTLEEREQLVEIIERRISQRKPAAYLTGEARFAGLSFFVDERVLIPRSPIAELIEQSFSPWLEPDQVHSILDLCTGSGCIAIACAYAFTNATVDAVDICRDALAVAKINVDNHHCSDRVELIQSDLYTELEGRRYDLIVSNPPYVNSAEWQTLPKEYHAEPKLGLEGGKSGLNHVEKILKNANKYLNKKGILVVEVGNSAEILQQAFPQVPFYWLEFERGGDGVFLITGEQLSEFF